MRSVEPIYADRQFYYLLDEVEEGDEIIVSTLGVPIEGMRVAPEAIELAEVASDGD
jgi:hypothetical protein